MKPKLLRNSKCTTLKAIANFSARSLLNHSSLNMGFQLFLRHLPTVFARALVCVRVCVCVCVLRFAGNRWFILTLREYSSSSSSSCLVSTSRSDGAAWLSLSGMFELPAGRPIMQNSVCLLLAVGLWDVYAVRGPAALGSSSRWFHSQIFRAPADIWIPIYLTRPPLSFFSSSAVPLHWRCSTRFDVSLIPLPSPFDSSGDRDIDVTNYRVD